MTTIDAQDGGLLGVVLLFVVLGFALRRLDDRLLDALRRGGLWLIAGAILPAYFMIILRGSLLQATGTAAFVALCLYLLYQRAPATEAPPPQRAEA